MTATTRKCKKEGCTASIDGKCLEGLPYDECPHVILVDQEEIEEEIEESDSDDTDEESAVIEQANSIADKTIRFYDGLELSAEDAYELTSSAMSRLIVLAGKPDSGKTTLLATIFELFQKGPFCEYLFSGSMTLVAFEKRCFLSRIESNNDRPDTDRTKPGFDQRLLHISLKHMSLTKPLVNLLFTDISGESFTRAIHDINELKKISLIPRADTFVLLVDGEKLVRLETRHETIATSELILRACIDSSLINNGFIVDVVFTKQDVIAKDGAKTETEEYINVVKQQLENQLAGKVSKLRFFNIAARPEDDSLPVGYGLEGIFPSWVTDAPSTHCRTIIDNNNFDNLHEFDKFSSKAEYGEGEA